MQNIAFASVGAKGMFTKEIEDALLANSIDLAVHSLKDLPTDLGDQFTLAAIPKRADARDVLVSSGTGVSMRCRRARWWAPAACAGRRSCGRGGLISSTSNSAATWTLASPSSAKGKPMRSSWLQRALSDCRRPPRSANDLRPKCYAPRPAREHWLSSAGQGIGRCSPLCSRSRTATPAWPSPPSAAALPPWAADAWYPSALIVTAVETNYCCAPWWPLPTAGK